MKKDFILSFAFVLFCYVAQSQGCVAIRSLVGFGQFMLPEYDQEPVTWVVNANGRYFMSNQDFIGSENQHTSPEDQRVNHIYVVDFAFTRMFDKGWSITFDLPFTAGDRTSWQEHENDKTAKIKRTTRAFGLSDVRVTAYKWLFDVSSYHKGNIQFGLGVKLPTGDYRYQDYFYKKDPTSGVVYKVMAPVNQSIQLGDGGTGISVELNAFYTLNKTVNLYGNVFYLFNPRDQNGTYSGFPLNTNNIESGATVNTVPDAYTARAGANFTVDKFVLWSGVRMEGLPVHDLIGGSNGNRRPGEIVSLEPGVNYSFKELTLYAFMPFPIYRTTKQAVPDQILDQLDPSVYHPSGGGFSDYMIFMGVLFKL